VIVFKFSEEKDYITHYANKLGDSQLIEILNSGDVKSEQEAEYLSHFFWKMVDKSIEDEERDVPSLFDESNEFWNEKIMYSLSGYLENIGYEYVWQRVSDQQ
jgi:hypothetical protein